jgi:hypothetical protein
MMIMMMMMMIKMRQECERRIMVGDGIKILLSLPPK